MQHYLINIDNGAKTPYELEVSHQEIPMHGLPKSAEGLVVAHLTDFHAGFGNIQPVHEEVVRQVEAVRPDLILLTGDYVDRRTQEVDSPKQMLETLTALKAPLGKYGVLGNHDHYRGIVMTTRLLEQAGVHPLLNENLPLENGLYLAGIDDYRAGTPHSSQSLHALPTDKTSLVMTHNPVLFSHLPSQKIVVFSGHTHGAQVALPFPSPKMVCWVKLGSPYVAGWYQRGESRLYVSRGIGVTRRPYRYHCPAEITFFTLVSVNPTQEHRALREPAHLSR